MNENVQLAQRLIAVVQLEDVRLVQAAARTSIRSRVEAGEVELSAQHSAKASQGIRNGVFYVIAAFDLRITSVKAEATEPKKTPLYLKVEYELRYRVPGDFKASKAELASFAKFNGVYNAWPYFREYVQTTTQRMNLPPVIMPVFRIPQPPKREAAATPSATEQAPPGAHSPSVPQE
jgi:hypothetical protein